MGCAVLFIFFFFSSRRRHTRFDCDWSSDVCSSDLATSGADTLGAGSRSASGPRFLVYSGLSLPAGRSSLSLYAYDRYRLRAHGYDSTVVQVPRGNVLALGVRLGRPLSPVLSLAPNVWF